MNHPGTKVLRCGKLQWIDVYEPTAETLEKLKKKFGFHELDVEDCLTGYQRAKIDEYEEYLFLILHIPRLDSRHNELRMDTLHLFVGKDLLISVHEDTLKSLNVLWNTCEEDEKIQKSLMSKGSGFLLYEIIDALFASGFPLLDHLEKNINTLENEVLNIRHNNDHLKKILHVKKNIIKFRRIIFPQRMVVEQLEYKNRRFIPAKLKVYYDDVLDKLEKINNNLEGYKELIESLQATNESLISHTTNQRIKVLTVFSVLMSSLTFLTGLYGMNVVLPFAEHPKIFVILLGIMFGVILLMLSLFKFRRWI